MRVEERSQNIMEVERGYSTACKCKITYTNQILVNPPTDTLKHMLYRPPSTHDASRREATSSAARKPSDLHKQAEFGQPQYEVCFAFLFNYAPFRVSRRTPKGGPAGRLEKVHPPGGL